MRMMSNDAKSQPPAKLFLLWVVAILLPPATIVAITWISRDFLHGGIDGLIEIALSCAAVIVGSWCVLRTKANDHWAAIAFVVVVYLVFILPVTFFVAIWFVGTRYGLYL